MPPEFKPETLGEMTIWVDALEQAIFEKFEDFKKDLKDIEDNHHRDLSDIRDSQRKILLTILSGFIGPLVAGFLLAVVVRGL